MYLHRALLYFLLKTSLNPGLPDVEKENKAMFKVLEAQLLQELLLRSLARIRLLFRRQNQFLVTLVLE